MKYLYLTLIYPAGPINERPLAEVATHPGVPVRPYDPLRDRALVTRLYTNRRKLRAAIRKGSRGWAAGASFSTARMPYNRDLWDSTTFFHCGELIEP